MIEERYWHQREFNDNQVSKLNSGANEGSSRLISFSQKQILEVDGSRCLMSMGFRVKTGMPLFKDTS